MVLKRQQEKQRSVAEFENDVKMYGTQAICAAPISPNMFENDVKMYGTQALTKLRNIVTSFENDVKMYGTQAKG